MGPFCLLKDVQRDQDDDGYDDHHDMVSSVYSPSTGVTRVLSG
jgi:hypothetical protein